MDQEALLSYIKEYPLCQTPDIIRAFHTEPRPTIDLLKQMESEGLILHVAKHGPKQTRLGPKRVWGWILRKRPSVTWPPEG